MSKSKGPYGSQDFAIVIPTYKRPQKIKEILENLALQSTACGRIVIVGGGDSVEAVVATFKTVLPVEYRVCRPPGQIRQRNETFEKLVRFLIL